MAKDNDAKKGFEFIWIIHNFNFCWHKTGEYLESPSFWMQHTTPWTLRLYPRGENDGEYISCYLCREEEGPEIVNADFQLFLRVGDSGEFPVRSPISFSKIYSFKRSQMEGVACFAWRREIFALMAAQKERLTLSLGCTILSVNGIKLDGIRHFGRTTIVTERISGTEVFDDPLDLESENCKDVDVKPLLEKDPLIGISVSCSHESLVIKIHPKSCHRIKYAICKVTLVNELTNGSPIEYVRCWIGEIKAHIWRYKLPYQETESVKSSSEFISSKALILHYDFAFSIGEEVLYHTLMALDDYQEVCNSLTAPHGYLKTPNFTLTEYLNIKVNTRTGIPTALDALKSLWTSGTFQDFTVRAENICLRTHKALLCARSATFKSQIEDYTQNFNLQCSRADIFKKLLEFLYTDSLGDQSFTSSILLYHFASHLKIETLQMKCRLYLTDNLHYETAGYVLQLAEDCRDSDMKAIAENYIITYLDLVQSTRWWYDCSKINAKLVRKTLLLKYERKKKLCIIGGAAVKPKEMRARSELSVEADMN